MKPEQQEIDRVRKEVAKLKGGARHPKKGRSLEVLKFAFLARHRNIWPVAWLCDALDVSRSGFHLWLNPSPSARSRHDEILVSRVDRSFKSSDRTYGARRVWHDVLAEGLSCGCIVSSA